MKSYDTLADVIISIQQFNVILQAHGVQSIEIFLPYSIIIDVFPSSDEFCIRHSDIVVDGALVFIDFFQDIIGKVGDDTFGRLLVKTLKDSGIETRGILIDHDVFTTLAFVSLDESGNRDFSFARKPGADTCIRPDELDESMIGNARVFHFGTLSLTDEPAASTTKKAIEAAKNHGLLISLDPNLRKPLWKKEEDARTAIEWSLHQADIVKISDEEIAWLWGLNPEEGTRKLLSEYGVSLVYATLGPKGCYAATQSVSVVEACPPGIHVVDTTGAGDIFGGAAMSCFLQHSKAPSELTVSELTHIVRFACTAASLSTQKYGGITSVPDMSEVLSVSR